MCDADSCTVAQWGRRQFVTQSLLATVGAWVLQGCGDGQIGGPLGPRVAPPLNAPLVVALADFPALAVVGGIARVDGGTPTPIAVARLGDQSFVALSMICTHQGFRPINIQTGGFECPNHGARFAPDGEWIGGQQTRDLLAYPLEFDEGNGTLAIG
jgi:Rieske Fe-S protein